jgi:phospholipid transport system substrate-binding protein
MNQKIVTGLLGGLLGALLFSSAMAVDVAPDVLAKSTTLDVISIIKQDKDIQAGNTRKVLDLVEAKVLPHFDFNRMTMLAVGKNWKSASAAQQQSLAKEFQTLLVRTYSNSLTNYKNQVIEFKPLKMQPADTEVTVRTEVIQSGTRPVPIDYSMEKTPNGWKVYDVIVDGVSLVTNYRGSFNTQVRQGGIDGLIQSLTEKNKHNVEAGAKK